MSEVAKRMRQTYYACGDKWFLRAAEEIERLWAALLRLRTESHYICDDCWYSCPKSQERCDESLPTDICTCGTDLRNKLIDKALSDKEA